MDMFDTVEEIIDFAISEELAANNFYLDLAQKVSNPVMKKVFEDFAQEELGHKAKLEKMKTTPVKPQVGQVLDLKISDYVVEGDSGPDMDYRDAIVLAMKKEKAAFKLYIKLAAMSDDPALRQMLLTIAQEEAKHKLRFEIEYDNEIMKEN